MGRNKNQNIIQNYDKFVKHSKTYHRMKSKGRNKEKYPLAQLLFLVGLVHTGMITI